MNIWQDEFMRVPLYCGLVVGVLCAFMGNFVLMRRLTFVSIALSSAAGCGMVLGYIIEVPTPVMVVPPRVLALLPEFMALLLTLLSLLPFLYRPNAKRHESDAGVGVLYACAASLAFVLLSLYPRVEAHGINIAKGQLLYSAEEDLYLLLGLAALVLIPHIICRKQLVLTAFDPDTALSQGLAARRWDALLLLTIGLVIGVCMRQAGTLFVFASLIVPPLAALQVFRSIRGVWIASLLVAFLGVWVGMEGSLKFDLPASPAVILSYGILFVLASALGWLRRLFGEKNRSENRG